MFRKFFSWIRQVTLKMLGMEKISDIAKQGTVVSTEMTNAVDFWMELYRNIAPWLRENRRSLCLPSAISSEIARLVTLEMDMKVTGSKRADYIQEQLDPVLNMMRTHCEYGCAGGGLIFKPYVVGDKIAIDVIKANAFIPLSFNSSGEIDGGSFLDRKYDGNVVYTRIETHRIINEAYVVTNKCYKSYNDEDIGTECSLKEVPDWENLAPETTLSNVGRSLFSYFKVPFGNTVDINSPLGVSVYSRAVSLIKDADEQYQRLMWEYEGGELAIDASEDAFTTDESNNVVLPAGKERLFRTNTIDPVTSSSDMLLKAWSPTLRDASYKTGLNTILQKIEFAVGLSYGTISDPLVVDKTAEEIKASKQRMSSNVTDIQKALQSALEHLVYAVDVYATLYKLVEAGKYETAFIWDDSIVVDSSTEREIDRQDCRDGVMQWYEYRMKWYGEDEETAKKMTRFKDEKTDDQVFGFDTDDEPKEE